MKKYYFPSDLVMVVMNHFPRSGPPVRPSVYLAFDQKFLVYFRICLPHGKSLPDREEDGMSLLRSILGVQGKELRRSRSRSTKLDWQIIRSVNELSSSLSLSALLFKVSSPFYTSDPQPGSPPKVGEIN